MNANRSSLHRGRFLHLDSLWHDNEGVIAVIYDKMHVRRMAFCLFTTAP